MGREIKYSVLQYKHSQPLNEAVNVAPTGRSLAKRNFVLKYVKLSA
jgi:hypothetical protein